MFYPAKFEKEDDGYTVTFRDIPEAITCGDDLEDAINMAKDALVTAMDFYFEDHRKVPLPSKALKSEHLVELPVSVFAKVLLLNEMIEQNVTNMELAKRMHSRKQDIQRVVDLNHATKIDTISNALSVLGKKLELRVA